MNKPLVAAIEYLSHIVDSTKGEDFILKDDARVLIDTIKDFSAYESMAGRRMGRHARADQREAQSDFVQTCYRRVDELVRGGMYKTDAAKQVKVDIRAHVEYETILKHYYAGRRRALLLCKQNHK